MFSKNFQKIVTSPPPQFLPLRDTPAKNERKMNLYYLEWTLKNIFCWPQPLPLKKSPPPSKILDPPLDDTIILTTSKPSFQFEIECHFFAIKFRFKSNRLFYSNRICIEKVTSYFSEIDLNETNLFRKDFNQLNLMIDRDALVVLHL
jgi:hypothetical protein